MKKLLRHKWSQKQKVWESLLYRTMVMSILRGESTSCLFFVSPEKFELVILNLIRLHAINKISLMWLLSIQNERKPHPMKCQ